MNLRSVDELVAVPSPAWPEIAALAAAGGAEVLEVDEQVGRRVLHRLQVTAGSCLGALALHCGGIMADHRWFRLYGGGSPGLPDLAEVNGLGEPTERSSAPPYLVIGTDVLGGRFAIDGGGLGISPGEVCYFGPDTLSWDGLGLGHTAFVQEVLEGSLSDVFESLRWPGWQAETGNLPAGMGISSYPPPFTVEGKDLAAASRGPVPVGELHSLYA